MPESPWWTVKQTADYFQCSEAHVRRMIARGDLKAKRVGQRLVRVHRDSLSLAGGAR